MNSQQGSRTLDRAPSWSISSRACSIPGALNDERTFELGNASEYGQHHAPRRRRRIGPRLGQTAQAHTGFLDAFGGGQDQTAGHVVSLFLKTKVCDKPAKATGVAREIKALRLSKIALETLFLIAYALTEFR